MSGRVELRPDAYHVPADEGVYVLGHRGPVRLTGASIALWIDRLAPHLDGRHTLRDLTAHLSPERRGMVERILATLRSAGVVRERAGAAPGPPAAADAGRYAHEVSFVDYFRDSAEDAVARYRGAPALVVGAGPLLPAVVRAALRTGLPEVRVAVTGEAPTDLALLARAGREAGRRDPEQRLVHRSVPAPDEDELAGLVNGATLSLSVGTEREPAWVAPLERCCARFGVPMAQAVLRSGEAWLVPPAEVGAPRWSAVRPRLRPATHPSEAAASPAAVAAVASQLAHGAFRTLTGVDPPPEQPVMVRIDLDTLDSQEHHVLAHPFSLPASAATRAGFEAAVAGLAGGERLSEEEFSRRAARLVDDRVGIVTLHEYDWTQSPLYVTQARAYDPVGLFAPRAYAATTRAGFSYGAARTGATMRALVHYGELMVDPRRLLDSAGRPLIGPDDDPYAALTALRAGTLAGAVWGHELGGAGRARLVPAPVAFPRLRTATPAAGATAGLAAGLSWDEAVLAGLLGHCRRVTLAGIGRATDRYPWVDVASAELDPAGARCRDLLAELGELPEVYQVTDPLGVPTYAFCSGSGTVAYATGATAMSAVSMGLVQVLRRIQARIHDQPAIAPPAVPELPPALRGGRAHTAAGTPVPANRRWEVTAIAARLRETGRTTVAVPLDHDPGLAGILPHLVNVVVCDD